jgi:hypothetical protein
MNSNSNNNASASGAIDFRTLPDFLPSMCIPRVYPNISEGRIRKIFDELNIGVIDRVDIVSKTTEKGERFNRVFIHMDRWFNNSNASVARERLLGGKDIKVVYDDPWFWKISAYKPAAEGSSNNNNNNNNKKKATIQFDSSDDEKEKEKERRKPKVTDIKPLTEPRPRPYNNNNNNNKGGCNKARREDTFQRPVVERVKEEVVVIKQEKPYEEERPVVQRPILRDNNPKMEVPPPVQYDEAVIASTKKRVIIIRKEPTIKKETV